MSELVSQRFPFRVSVTTFNMWGNKNWPERAPGLDSLFNTLKSDVYLLQETTEQLLEHLDRSLGGYKRTHGNDKSTMIYWNDKLLTLVDSGNGDLGIPNDGNQKRDMTWVRLGFNADPSVTVFFCTAHFPWVGCELEIESGINQRIPAAARVCTHIRHIVPPTEPMIFGGDLNDDFHPLRILNEEMGLLEVFEALDLSPPITHPVRPSDPLEEMRPNRTLDWILCSLSNKCRVVGAFAKTIRGGYYPPVSDHLPVVAIFEIA